MSGLEPTKEPVSVIYVVGNLRTGGPTMQLLYLISNLDRSRFKPIVFVTTASAGPTDIETRLTESGIEVVRLGTGKIGSMFTAPLRLAQIARREAKVILHPYGFRSDIISWLSRVRPRLGNVRNNLRYNYQLIFGPRVGALVSSINLFFLHRADLVVACGSAVRKNLSDLGQDSVAIRNAIDPAIYCSLMCSDTAPDRPKHERATYVTIASNIPGKNIEFLVDQFADAPEGIRRLLVIGRANPALVKSHGNNPNVEFRGQVSKPGDAFLEADFFVSASEHEGIPNAVLETLMLGRPVVLSEIPAHLEMLDAAGNDVGATFTWTPASLDAALRKIEQQDYDQLCERCRKAARLHLSASEMARRYQVTYEALISNSADCGAAELDGRRRQDSGSK